MSYQIGNKRKIMCSLFGPAHEKLVLIALLSKEGSGDMGGSRRGGGGQGVRTPLKYHKNKGFLCKTGPDSLKNNKATKLAFNHHE